MTQRVPLGALDPDAVADGDYTVTVAGGVITGLTVSVLPAPTTIYMPLVAVVGGDPTFVFDANDQLVMTEVPLP